MSLARVSIWSLALVTSALLGPARAEPAADATLALAGFEAREGATADEAALVADLVTATLVNDGKIKIVERAQLARVMKEQALAASGAMSDAVQIKVAQLVGARWLLVGSLQGHRRGFAIVGRAIDSSSGQVAFADSVQVDSKDLLSAGARQLAHKLQDKLVGGATTASVGVDEFDPTVTKEAGRQLAQQIASLFPPLEGTLGEVLPNDTAGCHFKSPEKAFRGEQFTVSGHDSVRDGEAEKGYFLLTTISASGCSGKLKRSGGDEVSNGDKIASRTLSVSLAALTVGPGTDPKLGELLSQTTRESLKNQPGFEVVESGAQISLVGSIGGVRGARVIEMQALDKKGAVVRTWDLRGAF